MITVFGNNTSNIVLMTMLVKFNNSLTLLPGFCYHLVYIGYESLERGLNVLVLVIAVIMEPTR